MNDWKFCGPPPAAGKIIISDRVWIEVAKKPSWLARQTMRWLLQWRWEGYKP